VRGEEDRLDAVAGADVQRTLALAAHGEVGERDRRAVDSGHVVGVPFRAAGMVGRDQELVVRDESGGAVDDLGVLREQARTRDVRPQLGPDELVEACACDGHPEEEEPEQYGQLVGVAEPSQVRRQLR
jgi:hypothetical protein